MKSINFKRIALGTIIVLAIPFLVMQFTEEVNWGLTDFIVAGTLLFGAGFMYELIAMKSGNIAYRGAVGLAVVTALILIWVNLAVGIIGSENNPANLMYGGVLIVGISASIFTRFRPQGMANAMFITAIVQILVGMIALISGMGGTLVPDLFFAVMWFGSALLFRKAGTTDLI